MADVQLSVFQNASEHAEDVDDITIRHQCFSQSSMDVLHTAGKPTLQLVYYNMRHSVRTLASGGAKCVWVHVSK